MIAMSVPSTCTSTPTLDLFKSRAAATPTRAVHCARAVHRHSGVVTATHAQIVAL
jgi:hypothetical protein